MGKPAGGKGKSKEDKAQSTSPSKGKGKGKGSSKGKGKGKDAEERQRSRSERREPHEAAPLLTLDGKKYKVAVEQLAEKTAIKVNEIDQKALALLEALDKKGKAEAAIDHLKESLSEVGRDHTTNWRAYSYTLLKKFDEETYKEMKEEAVKSGVRRPRGNRESREDRKENREERKRAQDRFPLTTFNFNKDATEFVPKPWSPNKDAPDFVPVGKVVAK